MTSADSPTPGIALLLSALVLGALALAPRPGSAAEPAPRSNLRYDLDYPDLNYTTRIVDNDITRLQHRIETGELQLPAHPVRGYLDALLKELGIDPSSQVLIYSKTSLQTDLIDVATPRAVYFNDHTYVGFVHNTHFIEITTFDPQLGVMFYGLATGTGKPATGFTRESGRCLSCHDTYSMLGGGTPRVVVTSAPVHRPDGKTSGDTSSLSTDRTPFAERWGGWYVTGDTGTMTHLGNLPLDDYRQKPGQKPGALANAPRNLRSVAGLFDTSTYLTDKSDVVALMVLEHQTNVHNMMSRATYKARTAFRRVAGEAPEPRTWAELQPVLQKSFLPLVEPLTQALLMEGVVELESPVLGSSGYDAWFQRQGPRDSQGRSLRELDLQRRLFRYPLSYMLYTQAFDTLPGYMKDYVYTRVEKMASSSAGSADLQQRRRAATDILAATKPEFAQHAGAAR
jgi:hypothetical protein